MIDKTSGATNQTLVLHFFMLFLIFISLVFIVYPTEWSQYILNTYVKNSTLLLESSNGLAGVSLLSTQVIWNNINNNPIVDLVSDGNSIQFFRDYRTYGLLQKIDIKTGSVLLSSKYKVPPNQNILSFGIKPSDTGSIFIFTKNGLYSCPKYVSDIVYPRNRYGGNKVQDTAIQQSCVSVVKITPGAQIVMGYAGPVVWKSSVNQNSRTFVYINGILYIVNPSNGIIKQENLDENIRKMYIYNDKLVMLSETGITFYDAELMRYLKKINTVGKPVYTFFDGTNVYVGTSLGYVISVNIEKGNINYGNRVIQDGIIKITQGKIGGANRIIVGSTNEICVLESDGTVLWYTNFQTPITSFESGLGNLYTTVGTTVNKMNINHLCSILSHKSGDVLSYRYLTLKGKVSPVSSASLTINGNTYALDVHGNGNWSYVLDPKLLKIGKNMVSCGDVNSGGTQINLMYPKNFAKGYLYADIPLRINLGSALTIKVTDAVTKNAVNYFYLTRDGKRIKITGSEKTVRLSSKGKHAIIIEKEGYNPFKAVVDVKQETGMMQVVLDVIGLVVLLVIVYLAYNSFMGKSGIRR